MPTPFLCCVVFEPQKHFGVDLPHGVIAHMDPLLIKKIDWETTNNLEDWDITLEVSWLVQKLVMTCLCVTD